MNKVSLYNKEIYGEVTTPDILINELFDMLDSDIFSKKNIKWLDPCAGSGVFFKELFERRLTSLPKSKNKLFWMTEINTSHTKNLKEIFNDMVNVKNIDFFKFNENNFDVIIANPPFQVNGSIKVPSKRGNKEKDGKEMWSHFVKHSMERLKYGGTLLCITPVIWLKRDHKMHNFILKYKVEQMRCYDTGEANKLFKGNCQSPIVLFKLVKTPTTNLLQNVKMGEMMYKFNVLESIPMKYYKELSSLRTLVEKVGSLKVIKTSMRPGRPKNLMVSKVRTGVFFYKNVKTCILKKENGIISPKLVIEYSNIPCVFNGIPKLILAHKMYGHCYFDKKGEYGISNRDNYVIVDYSEKEMDILNQFLNLPCIIKLFDATRYRMRYLERYIFDFIPNITSLPDFPKTITEYSVKKYLKI
jgi:16S rRNA G966 N2-methylase RsmD